MGGRQQAPGARVQSLGVQNVMVPACAPGHALKSGCTGPFLARKGGCTGPFCAPGYGPYHPAHKEH